MEMANKRSSNESSQRETLIEMTGGRRERSGSSSYDSRSSSGSWKRRIRLLSETSESEDNGRSSSVERVRRKKGKVKSEVKIKQK